MLFNAFMISAISIPMLWLWWWLASNDRSFFMINDYMDHWSIVLSKRGLTIEIVSTNDSAPCSVKFAIIGNGGVRVVNYPRKTLKILRKIRAGKLDIIDITMMSETPYSKLP